MHVQNYKFHISFSKPTYVYINNCYLRLFDVSLYYLELTQAKM